MEMNTVFLGIITSIMFAGVPWAYLVHGRLTKIETKIESMKTAHVRIDAVESRVGKCQTDIAVLQIQGDRP